MTTSSGVNHTRPPVDRMRWFISQSWARETGVTEEVARRTLDARGFLPVPVDEQVIAAQQRTVDLYTREGLLPAGVDVRGSFDPSFNAYSS